jgi:PleD family two-component response regulator
VRLHPASLGIDEPVTVSVGVAVAGSGDIAIPGLVERADQALYRAKRLGRDRVVAA